MKNIYCILIFNLMFISLCAQPESIEMTHYLFPKFAKGSVQMKTGMKNDVLLNYNALSEQMIFEKNGNRLAMSPSDLKLVDTVFIENRKFVTLNDGFVELLAHSKWALFVEHKCEVEEPGNLTGYGGTSKTTATKSFRTIFSEGNNYLLNLPDGYRANPFTYYWLRSNGNLNKFTSIRELKKLYSHKENLFKAYSKSHRVKYDHQESIIKLIAHLESN